MLEIVYFWSQSHPLEVYIRSMCDVRWCEICACLHVPVGEAKHKKLKEGRVNEQILVIVVKLRETRQPFSPTARHLHGAS